MLVRLVASAAEQLCSAMKICPERALINPTAMKLINDEPVEEMNEIVSSPRRQEKTDSANEHMDDAEDCGGGESDTESPDDLPIDVIDESGDVDGE
uniref:Uncharacterized protein n=1 Tax=Trichuris muris TaxID=70415 RepID=A0A5S6Q412_TRIMR